jgi:hypothetical protein
MTTSIDLSKFSAPLDAPQSEHVNGSHPRFMQIMAHLNNTHPDVKVGQVWEDINPDNYFRRILITAVRDDGVTEGVTVWIENTPDHDDVSIGDTIEVPTYSFRVDSEKVGFRLRGVYVSLDDAGVPHNLDAVPARKSLSSMVKVTPRKKAVTTSTTTPKTIGSAPKTDDKAPKAAPKTLGAPTPKPAVVPGSKDEKVRSSFPEKMPQLGSQVSTINKEDLASSVQDTPMLDQVLALMPARSETPTATGWINEPRAMKARDEIARIISPSDQRTRATRPSVFQNMVARIALEELGIDLAKKWAKNHLNSVAETGIEADLHPYRQSARDFKAESEKPAANVSKELVSIG